MIAKDKAMPSVPAPTSAAQLALAVLMERIQALPQDDKDDLFELSQAWFTADCEEERASARAAMDEILAQQPSGIVPMAMADATAAQVADAIILFCNKHGDLITNLRLQKLLFYTQAWYLALPEFDRPLFDDRIEAWIHGPAQPATYGRFKEFGYGPIKLEHTCSPVLSLSIAKHLENVMAAYGHFTAFQLEQMTHAEQPWLEARAGLAPDQPSSNIISHETMKRYYRARL